MLSPKTIRLLKNLTPHFIMWSIGGMLYVLLERGLMGEAKFYPSTGNPYDFASSLWGVIFVILFGGLVLGLLEEVVFKRFLLAKSFAIRSLVKTTIYLSFIMTIILLTGAFNSSTLLGVPLMHPDNVAATLNLLTNFVLLSVLIYLTAFIALTQYVRESIDRIGTNAVTNFFTGKYTTPKIEDRIFMFLDMRSSTTIAEKLGHEEYYKLLNLYYKDMTDAIINTAGEIYQYVGDEIVVSWKLKRGIKNNNCIQCFFLIQRALANNKAYYIDKFGVAPGFKAGLHCGQVTTGEIGVIKKEILFTGDVLNTTARIQSLCNEQQVDLLISGELKNRLQLEPSFEASSKGNFELRGRDQSVELFAVGAL